MINTGKESEAIFSDFLEKLGSHVERFEDYADVNLGRQKTRKIVSTKPSDFIVTLRGITAFTEVKSMSKGTRFDFSRIERHQWRTAIKVTRAQGLYFFFLHFLESNPWYQVPAKTIIEASKKSLQEAEIKAYECSMEFPPPNPFCILGVQVCL